ncbi:hypothetical protein CPSG_07726 [Coccidioides posadasii str. Silveira]|uniref:Uncharacterized protein n=1 Tax=Coccidioides posadasii (strain RMSCC 757 / Silveira) TaxID=443226 RepID=E9DDT5_COCPS|nr:hypothetical protein CPSG_07726 [Coccidioides posadasii str. Silveira]
MTGVILIGNQRVSQHSSARQREQRARRMAAQGISLGVTSVSGNVCQDGGGTAVVSDAGCPGSRGVVGLEMMQ